VFGFFGLVLLAITRDLCLSITTVDIGNGQVTIRTQRARDRPHET
jgi:hypothetical protein